MELFLDGLRWTHVIAGFIGLTVFWIPIFTRKGGKNHRFYGKIFKYSAYVVLSAAGIAVVFNSASALARGITPADEPAGFGFLLFLGYLALVTFIMLRHGLQVLQNKADLVAMNRPIDRLLGHVAMAASVGVIAYALLLQPSNMIVLLALSPIGFGASASIRATINGKRTEKKAWMYEHLGALLGTGIAFHTAFFVFGASRLFDLGLDGLVAVIPWILPAAIGIPASAIWTRHYKKKFGDLPA